MNPSDFWELMSYYKFGCTGDGNKRQDLLGVFKMHPKCSSQNSVQGENDYMEPGCMGDGKRQGLRLRALPSCHKWAGAHLRVHSHFCTDTVKCVLFSDIVEEKVGPERYSNFSVLILECLNRVYL